MMVVGKGMVVVAALLAALDVHDLAAMAGGKIPGLPMSACAGSSLANLLAVGLALIVLLVRRPPSAGA
jgi:hypothetical protein